MSLKPIIAGDTFDQTIEVNDYPASDGWTLKYRLAPKFATPSMAAFTLTATTNANGRDYDVQASPATTAAWVPGTYNGVRWVEKVGARQTLKYGDGFEEFGLFEVKADPSALAQGYDGRSQARKAVDDLKSAMATFHSSGGRVKSYSIGNRQMEFENQAEIVQLIDYWQRLLDNEEATAKMAAGLGNPRNIGIRFNRI
jgi:hypothetical protein